MRLDVTYICSHVCEISRKIGFESFGAGLGKHPPSKTDEFSEKFLRGGSFPIQKFMFQIFAIIKGTSVMNFGNKSAT